MIPPITVIKSLLVLKIDPKAFIDNPNMKNVVEIPSTKKSVFLNKVLLKKLFLFSLVVSLLDKMFIYTGNIGITQGEKKDIIPSINKTNNLKFSIILKAPQFFLYNNIKKIICNQLIILKKVYLF